MKAYTRKIGMDIKGQNLFAEAKLRGERRAGELLRGMKKVKNQFSRLAGDILSPAKTLKELGISKKQSSRYQQTAAVPKAEK